MTTEDTSKCKCGEPAECVAQDAEERTGHHVCAACEIDLSLVAEMRKREASMTEWEKGFFQSVRRRIVRFGKPLTEKQRGTAYGIRQRKIDSAERIREGVHRNWRRD